jgi:uncharacterized membrane protein YeaQ/YmgE (transglycosylase-associated protein family)
MFLIVMWLIIGAAAGGGMAWFMEDRGGISQKLSILVGIVAGEIGGFVFMMYGAAIVGRGPEFIFSFLAAAVTAAVVVLLAGMIKK